MINITQNKQAELVCSIVINGAKIKVSGSVDASVVSMTGQQLVASKTVTANADGSVTVPLSDVETGVVPVGKAMLTLVGSFGIKRLGLQCDSLSSITRSALFVRDLAIDAIREDRLSLLAGSVMPEVNVSDDYLWDKILSAESFVSGLLRVPLAPTRYFPIQPSQSEITALAGAPWAIDAGYDYDPGMFQGDKWGYIVTRHRPIISVEYMRFCYPTQDQGFFDVPREWLRIDSQPGHIRMIPASAGILVGSAGFALSTLINRRAVPDMVQISYTAGLKDAAGDYPELLDVIKKKAVLNILADAYLPQSGSISADGLSQSLSVDMSKYSDAIDEIINGPKGTNGGLMTRIHGIRSMVM